ncbi:TPA: restriction endonuclease subunit S, partial [Enterobacter kobei]
MSEWKKVLLTDVSVKIGDGLHGTPTYDESGDYHFINGNNLLNGKISIKPDTKKINKTEFDKIKKDLDSSTILLSINGTIGNVSKYTYEKCALGKSVCYINLDENIILRDYFYYECLSYNFQSYLDNIATGTTIPNVPLKGLRSYEFRIPPITEQKAITSVLSSLDDKIDLLHRQNKTLESMAETLFRQWFIEEAQDEWPEKSLNQYVELNKSSISKKYDFKEIQYLDTGSLTKGKISELQTMLLSEAPSRAKRLVNEFDIIISTVRPDQCHYGICIDPPSNLVVSTGFCVISGKSISPFFIYYLLTSEDMTEYLHSIAEGSTSTYPSLKPEDIGNVLFLYPGEEKLKNFHKLVGSYWNKIHNNYKKIQT